MSVISLCVLWYYNQAVTEQKAHYNELISTMHCSLLRQFIISRPHSPPLSTDNRLYIIGSIYHSRKIIQDKMLF